MSSSSSSHISMAAPLFKRLFLSVLLVFLCFNSLSYAREQGKALSNFIHVDVNPLLAQEALTCKHSSRGKKQGVSLEVVHRHGPCSKLKHPSPSNLDLLVLDQERVDSIHARISGQSVAGDKAELESKSTNLPARSGASIGSANYIVSVGLGTPQKDLSLEFDTGSDVTWTQCKPCLGSCYSQVDPIFDPTSSSSYTNITCAAAECSDLVAATGVQPACASSTCVYGIEYGDKSISEGFLAKERLALTTDDYIDDFVFGCGESNQGIFSGSAGLIGLGRNQLSLVSQAASKYGKYFSYCLPQGSSSTGHLTLGKGGTTDTNFSYTPLLNTASFYFVDLQSISVGGRQLPISASVFSTARTIIDSGTVISRLPPKAYSVLSAAFKQYMSKYPSAAPPTASSIFDTCYDLSNYRSVLVPKVTLYFSGGGVLDLPATGILWYAAGASHVCLAFAGNSKDNEFGIVGNVQQQGFDVVYDVEGGRIGFGPNAC